MTDDADLAERLRDLPPGLGALPDRFERVRARHDRRRRRQAIGAAGAVSVAVVVAVAVPLLLGGGADRTTAPDPVPADQGPSQSAAFDDDAPRPGSTDVVRLAPDVTVERVGTATVDLGDVPAGAREVALELRCLSRGRFEFPDGASIECSEADANRDDPEMPLRARYVIRLEPGRSEVTIQAGDAAEWRLAAAFVRTEVTPWGVNAAGQTYGVANEHGTPDLVAVVTEEGGQGYALATELDDPFGIPAPRNPAEALAYMKATEGRVAVIPVYDSDGVTQVGTFEIGGSSPHTISR